MEPPETIDVQPSGCWILRGASKTRKGYQRCSVGGRPMLAHVLVYRVLVGPIKKGFQVHHKCHNRACVNPDHLVTLMAQQHAAEHYEEPEFCPQGHEYAVTGFRDTNGRLRCRPCKRVTSARNKAKTKRSRQYRCNKCEWVGLWGELVEDRCPNCVTPSGRWGPQHVKD